MLKDCLSVIKEEEEAVLPGSGENGQVDGGATP